MHVWPESLDLGCQAVKLPPSSHVKHKLAGLAIFPLAPQAVKVNSEVKTEHAQVLQAETFHEDLKQLCLVSTHLYSR